MKGGIILLLASSITRLNGALSSLINHPILTDSLIVQQFTFISYATLHIKCSSNSSNCAIIYCDIY